MASKKSKIDIRWFIGFAWFCTLLYGFALTGCSEEPEPPSGRQIIPCRGRAAPSYESPSSKTIVPGTISGTFSVTSTGEAVYTMPLETPPGRGELEPKLGLLYNSAQGNGVLGVGFSLAGVSSIVRCPQNLALDGQIREVRFDSEDPLCLDGRRLVQVGETSESIEYRTIPDTFTKIIGHFPKGAKEKTPNNALYFEVYSAAGLVTEFGRGENTRPLARGGVPQAFLASKTHDRRGNAMTYAYCLSEAEEYTAEYALQEILYTGFEGEPAVEATRSVRFVYGTKDVDDIRLVYARGMALQNSLRLNEIQMVGPGDALVRRYVFGYEQSPTSKRTRLVQVEMCGGDGACIPPTHFQYSTGGIGFEKIATQIPAPASKLASPMLLDLTGDGLADLLIPDTNLALSTPQNPQSKPLPRNPLKRKPFHLSPVAPIEPRPLAFPRYCPVTEPT